jgi:hypothetical protein
MAGAAAVACLALAVMDHKEILSIQTEINSTGHKVAMVATVVAVVLVDVCPLITQPNGFTTAVAVLAGTALQPSDFIFEESTCFVTQ